jgi:hypothetical protein
MQQKILSSEEQVNRFIRGEISVLFEKRDNHKIYSVNFDAYGDFGMFPRLEFRDPNSHRLCVSRQVSEEEARAWYLNARTT